MALDFADLAGLQSDLDLPASGLANFFFEVEEQPWGFDPAQSDGWRVIISDGSGGPVSSPPAGATTFREVPLAPVQWLTAPGFGEPAVRSIWDRDEDGLLALDDVLGEGGWPGPPRHQIGGWPVLEQSALWLECQLASNGLYVGDSTGYDDPRAAELGPGADDGQLLLQLESDDRVDWMWGDVGTLYFAVRRPDLAQRRFERSWMVLQRG